MTAKQFNFQKFHGNGNDFVFFEKEVCDNFISEQDLCKFAVNVCNRYFGVGADGVVFCDDAQKRILILNSDGSFAATCGNALRCYGLKLLRQKLWDGASLVNIQNFEGDVFATLVEGSLTTKQVEVAMGVESKVDIIKIPENNFNVSTAVFVQLANPHLVFVSSIFCTYVEDQFKQFGQWAQKEFGNSNISMICLNESELVHLLWNLSVYERGAGLTLCCGSGAVASRVALETLGLVKAEENKISFNLPGGRVDVSMMNIIGNKLWTLIGPSEHVYRGIFEWY